jgi:hypothetical protein
MAEARRRGGLAFSAEGHIAGLRVRTVYPLGATIRRLAPFRRGIISAASRRISNPRLTEATASSHHRAHRGLPGAGRPEAAVIECLMEAAHSEMRPRGLRRKTSFPDEFPTGRPPVRFTPKRARHGQGPRHVRLRRLRMSSARSRKIRGIGMSCYVESSRPDGRVERFVEQTGLVTVSGSGPPGRDTRRSFVRCRDRLRHRGHHCDMATLRSALGIWHARKPDTAVGGGALAKAPGGFATICRIAATMLEIAVEDKRGRGSGPRALRTLASCGRSCGCGLSRAGRSWDARLEVTTFFNPQGDSWGFGTVIVAVQIDRRRAASPSTSSCGSTGTFDQPLLGKGSPRRAGPGLRTGPAGGNRLRCFRTAPHRVTDGLAPREPTTARSRAGEDGDPMPRNPLGAKGGARPGASEFPCYRECRPRASPRSESRTSTCL